MYIRYEVYKEGEPCNLGFIMGLNETYLPDSRKDRLLRCFDEQMRIPECIYNKKYITKSYFTENGYTPKL